LRKILDFAILFSEQFLTIFWINLAKEIQTLPPLLKTNILSKTLISAIFSHSKE
jgi:hypothetical protein